MLRRPLNDWDCEYEIQDSTNEMEQKFYEYFLDYLNKIHFDMYEHQIIINPLKHEMEIRIKMKKLQTCFMRRFSLDEIQECYYRNGSYIVICDVVIQQVLQHARSLCYRDREE